jgi:Cytochrome P450
MIQQLTARVSSRVFLGEKLCRDKRWLDISIGFTINLMTAAHAVRSWPAFLRPIVHWFLTPARRLRKCTRDARQLIQPEVEARRKRRADAVAKGESVKSLDAIEWLDAVAKGHPFDFVAGQLAISFAAIHTTSATLTALLYDLLDNPEYIPLLRQEIVAILAEDGGWVKTSLHKLKLMDSCMKESQRISILGICTYIRPLSFRIYSYSLILLSCSSHEPHRHREHYPLRRHIHPQTISPRFPDPAHARRFHLSRSPQIRRSPLLTPARASR